MLPPVSRQSKCTAALPCVFGEQASDGISEAVVVLCSSRGLLGGSHAEENKEKERHWDLGPVAASWERGSGEWFPH